ncbi:unnamed protein product [Scytosiphon promiscuus]
MRPQGLIAANTPGGDESRLSFQNAALHVQQQASRYGTRKAVKLHMTARHRHASTSSCGASRARVRPRPEGTAAASRRQVLSSMRERGISLSPAETRLASSVMAGDENIEQLSRMMTKRGAATSTAAVWGLAQSSGSSGGNKGGAAHRNGERMHQESTQRDDEKNGGKVVGPAENGNNPGACASSAPPAAILVETEVRFSPHGDAVNAGDGARRDAPPEESAGRSSRASRNKARVDAALITARQKAFVKRVVELGLRRRATEVLGLMEDAKREGFPPFNIYMYNACITALARCGRWRQAMAILDHMRYTANAVEAAAAAAAGATAAAKAGTAGGGLEADAVSSDYGAAVRPPSTPNVVRPDVVSYSAAITACGNSGEWRRAVALLRVMREQGVPPNVVSYNAAAHACVGGRKRHRKGRLNGAGAGAKPPAGAEEEGWALVLALMAEMRKEGVDADVFTFSTAITACGNRRRRQRTPIAPDVVSVNAAIAACGRAGQWERALDLLDRMTARAGGGPSGPVGMEQSEVGLGSSPRNSGDSTVGLLAAATQAAVGLGTCGSAGDSNSDVETAGSTQSGLAWPAADSVSFNSAMEACANAGRWQEGIKLLPRMLEVGVRPNVCSYAAHLACLRAGGLWERALLVLEEMSAGREAGGVQPDLGCYAAVMSTLGEVGKWEQALDLLRLLQRKGVAGASAWTAEQGVGGGGAAAGAASLDAEEHRAAEAKGGRAAISSSPSAGPNLVCYNAALAACAKAREGGAALELLEEMEGRGVFDTASFNCAMLACRGRGQWHKATDILDRMVAGDAVRQAGVRDAGGDGAARRRGGGTVPRPDAYSFASAITACGDVGQADVAVELLREMRPAGVMPNVVVFNAVIRAISRGINGPASGAAAERTGAADAWKGRPGPWGPDVGLSEASKARGLGAPEREGNRESSWRRAYSLVVEMREAGLVPEVKTYNAILAVCQRAGAWRGALEVLEEMQSGRTKRPVVSSARRGAAGGAEGGSWVEEPTPSPDLVSFNTAMGACGKAGRWEDALRLLDELPDSGLVPDAISFNTAAAACARAENWEQAQEIIDRGRDAGAIAPPVRRRRTVEETASGAEGPREAGEDIGPRSVDSGGKRYDAGDPSTMGGFYSTVEEMVRRQIRGRKRGGGRESGEPPSASE